MSEIYAIGEALYDVIFKNEQPITSKVGGSMLNSCVSLGKLGCNVSLISEIGKDKIGSIILNFLQQNNVQTNLINECKCNSPIALAFLDEENNATYSFYKEKMKSEIKIESILGKDSYLLFGSSYALNESNKLKLEKLLKEAEKNNAVILYDPNIRSSNAEQNSNFFEILDRNIQSSTIVRASDEDMLNAFGIGNHSDAYEQVKTLGSNIFIYTSSKEVWLHTANINKKYSVLVINPKSTIGAGDNFNAGILYYLYKNKVTSDKLKQLPESLWDELIQTAIDFAINVCHSFDNYINDEIVEKYKLI